MAAVNYIESDSQQVMDFLEAVNKEYEEACFCYAPITSSHEAYAVILEEVEEFWEEVRKKPKPYYGLNVTDNKKRMREELTQIAAMCLRAVIDLELE